MSTDRADLHALLDRVPEGRLPGIRKLLLAVAVELDVAPATAEGELTDAARREIEAAEAYFDKGGRGISHEEILREFGLRLMPYFIWMPAVPGWRQRVDRSRLDPLR